MLTASRAERQECIRYTYRLLPHLFSLLPVVVKSDLVSSKPCLAARQAFQARQMVRQIQQLHCAIGNTQDLQALHSWVQPDIVTPSESPCAWQSPLLKHQRACRAAVHADTHSCKHMHIVQSFLQTGAVMSATKCATPSMTKVKAQIADKHP